MNWHEVRVRTIQWLSNPYRDIVDVHTDVYGGGQKENTARKLWGSGLILLPPGSPPLSNDVLPKMKWSLEFQLVGKHLLPKNGRIQRVVLDLECTILF